MIVNTTSIHHLNDEPTAVVDHGNGTVVLRLGGTVTLFFGSTRELSAWATKIANLARSTR